MAQVEEQTMETSELQMTGLQIKDVVSSLKASHEVLTNYNSSRKWSWNKGSSVKIMLPTYCTIRTLYYFRDHSNT